jgi:hypothetical protein
MIDNYEWRGIMVEIRRVLLDVWGPIGVRNAPNAQDEYDSYLGPLFRLLTTEATDDEIAEYLWRLVTEYMGLGPGTEMQEMYPTVAALRQISLPGRRS